jgi:thiol-disulfide isomerase/thioredoxin
VFIMRFLAHFLLLTVLLLAGQSSHSRAQDASGATAVPQSPTGNPQLPAPPFPDGLEWLNVPAPLTIEALRGRIVILDFWTFGCINCIHMIPVLEQLEDKYGDALLVIGVHSAKFENEGHTESLRQVVQRYDLRHPVINDHTFAVWNLYGVNAWPTFVVIDPLGNIAAMQPGEIPFAAFDRYISDMVTHFRSSGQLNDTPIELTLEGAGNPAHTLSFPAKVLADARSSRLFIADTNHHRIIIADLTTHEVIDVAGAGGSGFDDGDFETATFDLPRGMALAGDTLFVADTGNHAVRALDLLTRSVRTVAGTGEQSYERGISGPPLETPLSSPWDVAFGDGVLFISMAGMHQIWSLLFERNVVGPIIGSGREGLLDASFAEAELAQPSGLVYRDRRLYFADSESSSIRAADLETRRTQILAGPLENSLFAFGDLDGSLGMARLQHPLALTLDDAGRVYIADTYNSKIKMIDLTSLTTVTLTGRGTPGGYVDGSLERAAFDEPSGISYVNGRLYVADTNNHAIRVIDLAAGSVETLQFPNVERLQIGDRLTVIGSSQPVAAQELLPPQMVAPGTHDLVLRIVLPEGYKINTLAPSRLEWNNAGDAVNIPEDRRAAAVTGSEVRLPVTLSEGEDAVYGQLTLYYCREEAESLCFIDQVRLEVPVSVRMGAAATEIVVEHRVTPPSIPQSPPVG